MAVQIERTVKKFDYLVIGGGSGGVGSGRYAAAKFGTKVGIIEHKRLGGTCVNVGCVPKKVMFNLAQYIEDGHHTLQSYGVQTEGVQLNWQVMKQKRDAYIARLNDVYADMLKKNNVEYIKGLARFTDANTIECEGNLYSGEHILIASGSWPEMPKNVEGIEHAVHSDAFFELQEQPKSVVVVGGGYIGVELGQIFHALGTRVVHAVRSGVLRFADGEIVANLEKNMRTQGYDIRTRHVLVRVRKVAERDLYATLQNVDTKETVEVQAEMVLVAAGRGANVADLNLAATGVKLVGEVDQNNKEHAGAIWVDEYQNTTARNIYAIGDVTERVQLTPVAIRAGRILAERLFNGKTHLKMDYDLIPTVVFSHPPLATIGLTQEQAEKQYGKENIVVYRESFTNMFFNLIEDRSKRELSLFKLVCLKSDDERILGLHANGRGSDEILQGFSVAIKMGAKKRDFDRCVAIHPTASEEFVLFDPKFE